VFGRGEVHAAAATVHGAGALVVARASKREGRTSGARARVVKDQDRARVNWISGEGDERIQITYQGPVAPESHVDCVAAGSLGRNFDSAACWPTAR
jgi:uncharacterized protein YlxW (UPF0749 family)